MTIETLQSLKLSVQEMNNLWRKKAIIPLIDEVNEFSNNADIERIHRFTLNPKQAWVSRKKRKTEKTRINRNKVKKRRKEAIVPLIDEIERIHRFTLNPKQASVSRKKKKNDSQERRISRKKVKRRKKAIVPL